MATVVDVPDTTNPLDAALSYARAGWPVVPLHTPVDGACDCPKRSACTSPGKHPRTIKGVDNSSTDPVQIKRWWSSWRNANVAVDLKGAGLLDIAPDSPQWQGEFIARGLPRTASFHSGGGVGHEHYLYRRPESCPTHRLCKEGEYDLLSAGYAVMPPSIHVSGQPYTWVTMRTPDQPPEWAVSMLQGAVRKRQVHTNGENADEPPVRLSGDDLERWHGNLITLKSDGSVDRSSSLWMIACALAEAGATRSTIIHALQERDNTLGWHKYIDRSDAEERYDLTAERALDSKASVQPAPYHSNGVVVSTQGAPQASKTTSAHLSVVRMSDVEPEPIEWLWKGRLARGKATLLMGDPGLGKSLISHWSAATVSRGGEWPDGGTCPRGAAILFTIEDGLSDTVAPRLLAAGANMHQIIAVRGVLQGDSLDERMFALTQHLALLEELISDSKALLVVMDPVTAYLGPDVNSHKEADVRAVLGPLQLLAERTGVVLMMLMHLNKGTGVSALYRATGSIAFPAVARVVLGVAPDPNDDDGKRRLLLPVKMNIGKLPEGIGYRIETASDSVVLPRVSESDQPPVLLWDQDPVTVDATSAMDRTGSPAELGSIAEAKSALDQILANGRVPASECKRQIRESVGTSSETVLSRARKELGVQVRKEGFGAASIWYWYPPAKDLARARAYESMESLIAFDSVNGVESETEPLRLSNTIKGSIDSLVLARAREDSPEVCRSCGEPLSAPEVATGYQLHYDCTMPI